MPQPKFAVIFLRNRPVAGLLPGTRYGMFAHAGTDMNGVTPPPPAFCIPPTRACSQPAVFMLKPALVPVASWQPAASHLYLLEIRSCTLQAPPPSELPQPPRMTPNAIARSGTRYMGPPKRS